jgi:hypothetical protein
VFAIIRHVTKLSSESWRWKLYYHWYIESCIIDIYTSTIWAKLLKLLLEHYVANILVNYVAHNVFFLNWLWTYLLITGALLFFALLGLSGCFITCYDRRVRNDLAQPCRELCLCCCQPGYALVSSLFKSWNTVLYKSYVLTLKNICQHIYCGIGKMYAKVT